MSDTSPQPCDQPPPPSRNSRFRLPEAKLLVGSVVVALLVGEISLRLFAPISYVRARYERTANIFIWQEGCIEPDETLGYFHAKNVETVFENPEFTTRVHLNSEGFRDDEASLVDPKYLFVGDSFCFGWGVEQDQTVEALFEKETGSSCLNMGVAGYSNLQEFLLLERTLDRHPNWKPQVVWFYYENDLSDNLFVGPLLGPTLRKRGLEILLTKPIDPEAYYEGRDLHFRVRLGGWTERVWVLDLLNQTFFPPEERFQRFMDIRSASAETFPGGAVNAYECVDFLFRKAIREVRRRGLGMRVFYIPHVSELEGTYEQDPRYPTPVPEFLRERFDLFSIPYHDLTQALELEDFYSMDTHWTAQGNRKAAAAIREDLEKFGLAETQTSKAPSNREHP